MGVVTKTWEAARYRRMRAWAVVALLVVPQPGWPFALLPDPTTGNVQTDLETAARWSAQPDPFGYGSGFHDGLQVAVAADFAERLQVTDPVEVAMVRQIIRQAFAAWETPDLWFDVDFERVPVEGVGHDRSTGWEVDLFAVPSSHPVFSNLSYFGYTQQGLEFSNDRLLSNGQRVAGNVITGVDIFINADLVLTFSRVLPQGRRGAALQRLLMHEIGHGVGLGHPNTFNTFNSNFDTDGDAFDPMVLLPQDPFAMLMYSEHRNANAVMSNDRTHVGPFLYFTELQYDDRGGRDALYPSLHPCAADCLGNGDVQLTEVITGMMVALGHTPLAICHRADVDGDGAVSVSELVHAIDTATDGCVARPTATVTSAVAVTVAMRVPAARQ